MYPRSILFHRIVANLSLHLSHTPIENLVNYCQNLRRLIFNKSVEQVRPLASVRRRSIMNKKAYVCSYIYSAANVLAIVVIILCISKRDSLKCSSQCSIYTAAAATTRDMQPHVYSYKPVYYQVLPFTL